MKSDRLLAALLIFGLVVRLLIIFVPTFLVDTNFLISNSIAMDDALITLKIAKNIHSGLGFSFDNVEQTNASSFVWTYILSPFGFLDNQSFLLLALVLCSVFFVLSGYFVYRICFFVSGKKEFGLITSFLYLFNPFFILISLNGLETSLFVFFLLLSLNYYLLSVRTSEAKKTNLFLFAIFLSLTILTREDGIYLFLAFLIDYLFLFREIEIGERFRNFVLIFVFLAIFVSPVYLLRYIEFGHIRSSSAYYYSSIFAKDWVTNPASAFLRKGLVFLMTMSVMSLMAGNVVLSFLGFFISKRLVKRFALLSPLVLFSLLELFHYTIIMPILRLRYIFAATIILVLGAGFLFFHIKRRISNGLFYASLVSLLLVLSYFTIATWTGYTDIGDSEIRVGILLNKHIIKAAEFMESEFPGSKVGVSHIGTFAYFSPSTIISDRNGKISYEATDYNIRGRIDEYFERRGVEYLAGFLSRENLERVIDSDIVFSEPIRERIQLKFKHLFGYYAVIKFRKDYVGLMSL